MACCDDHRARSPPPDTAGWRRALWIAPVVNSGFFLAEVVASAAAIKSATLILFASCVLGATPWHAWYWALPHAEVMGVVGLAALVANGGVSVLGTEARSFQSEPIGREAPIIITRNLPGFPLYPM